MIFLLSVSLLIFSTSGAEIPTSKLNESSRNEANVQPPSPITVIRQSITTDLPDSARQNISLNDSEVYDHNDSVIPIIPAEVPAKPSDVPTAEDDQPLNDTDSTDNRRMSYLSLPKLTLKPQDRRPKGLICLSPASIKNIRIILMYILQNPVNDLDITTIKAILNLLVELRNQLLSVPTSADVVDVLQKLYILENNLLLVAIQKQKYVIPTPEPAPNDVVNNLVTIKYSYPALNTNCRLAFEKLTKFVANAYRYLAKNPICGGNTGAIPQILEPQNSVVLNDQNLLFDSNNVNDNLLNDLTKPHGNTGLQSPKINDAMNFLNVLPLDHVLDDKPSIILPSPNNDDQTHGVVDDIKKKLIVQEEPTYSTYTLNDIISGNGYPLQLGPHYVPQQMYYPQKNIDQNEQYINNPYGKPIFHNSLPYAQAGSSISDSVINTPRPTDIENEGTNPTENYLLQTATFLHDDKNPGDKGNGLNDLLERLTAATIKNNAADKNKWYNPNFETDVSNSHINEPHFKIEPNGNSFSYNSYKSPQSLTHVSPNNNVEVDAIKLVMADNDNLVKPNNPLASNKLIPEPVRGLKSYGNDEQYKPPNNIPIIYYDAKGNDIFEALKDDAVKASIVDNNKSLKHFPISSINDTPQPFDTEFNGYNQLYNPYTLPNSVNYVPNRNNILEKIRDTPIQTDKDKLIKPFKIKTDKLQPNGNMVSPIWKTEEIKNPYGYNLEYYNPNQNDIKLPYYDYTAPNIYANPNPNTIVSDTESNPLPFGQIKEILPDLTNKLVDLSKKQKIVELTYVLKPNTLLYKPMYVVKYRLPYETFVQKAGKLLKDKPLLRTTSSELYKELIAVANVTKMTPDLKPEEKDDVISLVSNTGALVDFKVVNGDAEESISKFNITSSAPLQLPNPQFELPTPEIHPQYSQMPSSSAISQQKPPQDFQTQPQFSAETIPNQSTNPSQIVWESPPILVKAFDRSSLKSELIQMLTQGAQAKPLTSDTEAHILPQDLHKQTQIKQGMPNGVQMQPQEEQIQNQNVQFPLETSETSYNSPSVPRVQDTKPIFPKGKLDFDNERQNESQANLLNTDTDNESSNSFGSYNIKPSNATSVAAETTASVRSKEKPIPEFSYYRYDEDQKVFKPFSLPNYDV